MYQEETGWHFIYAFKKESPCFIKTHLSPNTTFCIRSQQLSCILFTWSLKEFKSMPLRFQTYPSSLSTITVWLFCYWNPSEVRRLLLKHVSSSVSLSLIKQSASMPSRISSERQLLPKSISKHSAKPFHPFYYLYAHTDVSGYFPEMSVFKYQAWVLFTPLHLCFHLTELCSEVSKCWWTACPDFSVY